VQTGSIVGVVVGEEWELRVRPRLAIPRLMFLLAYARDQAGWRRQLATFGQEDDLWATVAHGFSWQALSALQRGPLRGYVRRDEERPDLRGRVLFERQLARGGLPLPAHVAFDDFTEDVLENRMLRTATQLLLRLRRVSPGARRRLLRVRTLLDTVSLLDAWRGVKAPQTTRLNAAYAPALRLAELVLASASVSAAIGDVRSTTFVFDMNRVFEDFVTAAFREAMRPYGGLVREQVPDRALDEGGRLRLRPDLAWWLDGGCAAVLDAKYKAIDDGVMKHPDAYQMLAYCTAYELSRGFLVYAKDAGQESRTHRILNAGTEIVVTAIDVEREPEEVLAAVATLARLVAASRELAAAP
jgi:5-methylcytosine-specific restriction enzyme subunit McrC